MDTVFWVIVVIVALMIVYVYVVSFREGRLGRKSARSAAALDPKEHGIDLQARRKLHDDVT